MKKSSFVAMLLGTVSGMLFALGMCMALIEEWHSFTPGLVFGCAGILLGLITVIIWRKMEHKPPIRLSGKSVLTMIVGDRGNIGSWRWHVLLYGMGQDDRGDPHWASRDTRLALPDSSYQRD